MSRNTLEYNSSQGSSSGAGACVYSKHLFWVSPLFTPCGPTVLHCIYYMCNTDFTLFNWYAMICLTCFRCVWLTSYHVTPWFFFCVLCVWTHASDLSLHICNWFAMLCLTCFRCVRLVNVLRCVRLTSYDVCVTPSLHYVCVTPCPTFRYPE